MKIKRKPTTEPATIPIGCSLKMALQKWEKDHDEEFAKAKFICLDSQEPPLQRMTPEVMRNIRQCRHLILSNNLIERVSGLNGLKNLRILNLSRNNLRTLNGIDCLNRTLEELWVSYNYIERLKPLENMRNLKVLLVSHNDVNDWNEVACLANVQKLTTLTFSGNPLQYTLEEEDFRREIKRRIPKLKMLDFQPTNMSIN